MPYIRSDYRRVYDKLIDSIPIGDDIGCMNYVITRLINRCVDEWNESYDTMNEVMGLLECVKAEFYRRRVAPYEDKKILEHGDVY